jgi:methyl-accepting chemotaxis protein
VKIAYARSPHLWAGAVSPAKALVANTIASQRALRTTTMAEALAGGDLPVRVPESGWGEIRTLERAFNTMAGSLGDARAEWA